MELIARAEPRLEELLAAFCEISMMNAENASAHVLGNVGPHGAGAYTNVMIRYRLGEWAAEGAGSDE